jgi:hypothetical protein
MTIALLKILEDRKIKWQNKLPKKICFATKALKNGKKKSG